MKKLKITIKRPVKSKPAKPVNIRRVASKKK